MQNNENPSSSHMDDVKAMFDNYYSNNNGNNNSSKPKKTNILTKYFNPRNDNENFRIVKRDGEELIDKAYFHIVEVNDPKRKTGKNKNKKILCPRKNGHKEQKKDANGNLMYDTNGKPIMVAARCRCCEEMDRILATQDQSVRGKKKDQLTEQELQIWNNNREIFKRAMKYEPKLFHILKGIDRALPKDGIKFWRFKDNAKKQGILDKLAPAINLFQRNNNNQFPIDNVYGADLTIMMADFPMPNGRNYRDVNLLQFDNPSKLHDDPNVVDQWLNEKVTWRDVFKEPNMGKLSPYDYMDRVLRGVDPFWDESDQQNKRWVFPDPMDAALMAKANERSDQSLEGNSQQNNAPSMQQSAADVVNQSFQQQPTISNVTSQDAGQFNAGATTVSGQQFVQQPHQPQQPQVGVQPPNGPVNTPQTTSINPSETINNSQQNSGEYDIDDLPF